MTLKRSEALAIAFGHIHAEWRKAVELAVGYEDSYNTLIELYHLAREQEDREEESRDD